MTPSPNRRVFLGAAATTTAALAAPRARAAGPNDTLQLGIIGCGKRGPYLIDRFRELPDVRFTAVCDVHAGHLARGRERAGGEAVKPYADFRALLDDPNVDAVIVATPTHWHALPAVAACAAGKDVYLEKPVATSVAEGRAVVLAAAKHDRIVQIGTQQRSWDLYQKAVDLIRAGTLGAIREVKVWDTENHFPGWGRPADAPAPPGLDWNAWLGPAPERPYNPHVFAYSYWHPEFSGGWTLEWAVHHYDIVHWAMDVTAPVAATCAGIAGGLPDDLAEWPDTVTGALEYGPGPVSPRGFLLQYTARRTNAGPGAKLHGKSFHGTEGTLVLDRAGFTLTGETRKGKKVVRDAEATGITENSAVVQHAANFVRCVRGREQPFASIDRGHTSTVPGHLLNIAYRVGRTVRWDPKQETIPDDTEAAALLARSYREPWTLSV
jgi:predicted dehydrogenase